MPVVAIPGATTLLARRQVKAGRISTKASQFSESVIGDMTRRCVQLKGAEVDPSSVSLCPTS